MKVMGKNKNQEGGREHGFGLKLTKDELREVEARTTPPAPQLYMRRFSWKGRRIKAHSLSLGVVWTGGWALHGFLPRCPGVDF